MSELIPIVDLHGKWSITLNLSFAMANNYIGEVRVQPKQTAVAVLKNVKGGRMYKSWTNIYYGTPDERLKKLFGYSQEA